MIKYPADNPSADQLMILYHLSYRLERLKSGPAIRHDILIISSIIDSKSKRTFMNSCRVSG